MDRTLTTAGTLAEVGVAGVVDPALIVPFGVVIAKLTVSPALNANVPLASVTPLRPDGDAEYDNPFVGESMYVPV